MGIRLGSGFWEAIVLCLLGSFSAIAAGTYIEPGPTVMSPEEQALQADPSAGIEHAIILVEETDRNENLTTDSETAYHLRAKILSNEGRDLANIEIPIYRDSKLKEWWGRTILPDGTVRELGQSDLERQSELKSRGTEVQSLKAALPGVVPGAVIDYGYVVRETGYVPYDRVTLQRRWLVKRFKYRWKPTQYLQGAYRVLKANGLDVQTNVEREGIWVRGRDLPPVVDEPQMPPDYMVRAAVVLYYLPRGADFDDYWDDIGKSMESIVSSSVRKKKSVERALAEINLPEGGDLESRLQAAYDWTTQNITRTGLMSFEEVESTARDDSKRKRDTVAQVLDSRKGSVFDVHLFYLAIARGLGAEASLVFAANRNYGIWDSNLKSTNQFDGTLVAVGAKGGLDSRLTYLDPGSGLRYGEIPWWMSGVSALLVAKSGGRPVETPTGDALRNVADSKVTLSFTDDNEILLSRWTRSGTGQVGHGRQQYLRKLPPDERREYIEEMCGLSSGVDVVTAEAHGLNDLRESLGLECETEWYTDINDDIGSYRLSWDGPWVRGLPDFSEVHRVHPVIFDFPRVDLVRLEATAPEGFAPREPPEPVSIEGPLGKYSLRITRTDDGYSLERGLTLYLTALPAERYGELRSFIEDARRHDRTWLSFERTESP